MLFAEIVAGFSNCHSQQSPNKSQSEISSEHLSRFIAICIYAPQCRQLKGSIGTARHHLVEALGRRHGSLDRQATNVLPALLQQRDEVVDRQHDVGHQLLLLHADVADRDTHAQNLLELELDGRLDLGDLGREVVGVRDGRGELAGCEELV
jgi:hypothetical protein